KDLSEKIVISTGRIVSWPCVRELNSLQKAMMLMPCGPSAVPTGGAGLALPAGICSLTNPVAFFAIELLLNHPSFDGRSPTGCFRVGVVADCFWVERWNGGTQLRATFGGVPPFHRSSVPPP